MSPTKRFVQIPDNNRVWLSIGASYKWSEATTIDVGYSHIFIAGRRSRDLNLRDPSRTFYRQLPKRTRDLISVGMRTRW